MAVMLLILDLVALRLLLCYPMLDNEHVNVDCFENENRVQYANGSLDCYPCLACGPGLEPNLTCGSDTVAFGAHLQSCRPCAPGYYSARTDEKKCKPCSVCVSKSMRKECTSVADTECMHVCKNGSYWDNPADDCIPCCYCDQDGRGTYSNISIEKCKQDSPNSSKVCATPSASTHDCPERSLPETKSRTIARKDEYIVVGVVVPALLIAVAAICWRWRRLRRLRRSRRPKKSIMDFPEGHKEYCTIQGCEREIEGGFEEFWNDHAAVSNNVRDKCEAQCLSLAKSLDLSDDDIKLVTLPRKAEGVFELVRQRHPTLSMAVFVGVLKDHGLNDAVKDICELHHPRATSLSINAA